MTIRRFLNAALIAGVALFLMAASASASIITYNSGTSPAVTNIALQATELNGNVVFPDFNCPGCTLTSVSITLEGDISGSISLHNGDVSSQTSSGTTTTQFTGGSLFSFSANFGTGSQLILAGGTYLLSSGSGTNSATDVVTSGLSSYVGTGFWNLPVSTLSGLTILGGGGNMTGSQTTQASAEGTITYTYTPAGTVPEPATLSLIGGALLGLGVLGRKKLFRQ
ncbi:MAG: choice-of-anchor E domain-containing protein [Bryobacteraceae bacterium]|jgi:hypothetical protein